MPLTQARLKEFLHYDPDTGIFTWIQRPTNRINVGDRAGCVRKDPRKKTGYITIRINGVAYFAHRLVFLYMIGRFPEMYVDHKDHNGLNNQWDNLREATSKENAKNVSLGINNKSGMLGVIWREDRRKWMSFISIHKKRIYLYYGDDFKAACTARKAAEVKYDFHPNHGLTPSNDLLILDAG